MKLLGDYINGNYRVGIFEDGTKIRSTNDTEFRPIKCESMDIKITNKCECGCPYCHENSTPDGLHGDILDAPFIDTLLPYTEMAIGGGNPLTHPQLIEFLHMLKDRKLIANMTVNQRHFIENENLIRKLVSERLIYGIGISLTEVTDELITLLKRYPNAVLHVINGLVSPEDLKRLYDNSFKILILGYKQFRRGEAYYSPAVENGMSRMYDFLPEMFDHFEVVSFDNLAVKQLEVKRLLTEEEWNNFYMGDDGQFTMYVDMVNRQFAKSSVSTERFSLMDDIEPMFAIVKR